MRRRCDENHRCRTARLVELGNLRDVGGANRSASAHTQRLGERRIDAGERDETACNFDARGTGLRVEAPGRFDRAADALDLIAQNRFFDQRFAKTSRVVPISPIRGKMIRNARSCASASESVIASETNVRL